MATDRAYRIEIFDPSHTYSPPPGVVRVVYSTRVLGGTKDPPQYRDTGEYEDVPLAEMPRLIERMMSLGAFEHARNLANAWFVELAHVHGFKHVELGPVPSKSQ